MKSQDLRGTIVFKEFEITQIIASGTFSQVYRVVNLNGDLAQYAVKAESNLIKVPQVLFQYKLYKLINKAKNEEVVGFPYVYAASTTKNYNYLLMQMLGQNLQNLLLIVGGKFSLKTVLKIGFQALERIQFVHFHNFIHRDIKPQNFLVGLRKKSKIIHLVDLGLCKRYRNEKQHIQNQNKKNQIVGSYQFSSLNSIQGFDQSRRDDLQSLCYVLIYFLKGYLPWSTKKYKLAQKQDYSQLVQKKLSATTETICQGIPPEFELILSYTRSLKFDEDPDYDKIRDLLESVARRNGINLQDRFDKFDWAKNKYSSVINYCNSDQEAS